ncbi:3-coathanger stack domain-containing protein [Flavobacterium sp.]|uniref:3-coathanger stack domain-containing protein n=1 Tax=Flavobacterium sp. TaxID=239 RepID=UPI00286E1F10|nr:3-coathanger stack domain-containing protein [Flavobacterium sp.]
MKNWLVIFFICVGVHGWGQSDTLYEENLRKVADIVFSELNPNLYDANLLNRSFSSNEITINQIKGNYSQIHSIVEFFSLYQDIAYSYIDSTKLMSVKQLGDFINTEFANNESTSVEDVLIQPFGFLLHNVSIIDSNSYIDSNFSRNNFSLIPLDNEEDFYSKIQLKSGTLIEFYPESGYLKGNIKYVPDLISISDDISNLHLSINVGNGFVPFNSINNLIEYDRTTDSLIGTLAFDYLRNDTLVYDTLTFYLTTKGEEVEKSNGTYWEYVTSYSNSTPIDFEIGTILGCGNETTYARRPIIIIPPYRPSIQPFSMQKYFTQFNVGNLFNKLSDLGYDVFFIKLQPGNESLELAAQAVSEYITMINQNKAEGFPNENWENIVIGYSMGGQITRYALKKMEKDHMESGSPHHHTRLFVPYDSPHLGANIPMFTQLVYSLFSESNIFAYLSFAALIDEASQDMSIAHVVGSDFIPQAGTNIVRIYPDITCRRTQFVNSLTNGFNHQFTSLTDTRRSFPTFTRNIAVSTGSNTQDYNELYNLNPGKLLFSQNGLTVGYFGLNYKLRRLYAAKYAPDHTLFRIKDQIVTLGIPITIYNKDFRAEYGEEYEMSQSGFKDEFYDKAPTGACFVLRSNAFFLLGQRHYENHMGFLPMVSALAINKDIWGLGNLHYNLKDERLMYNKFNFIIGIDESETHGYPNLGHPSDHFNITPFEAVYCDPQTYDHIKLIETVEDANDDTPGSYDPSYLDYTTEFIVNEVEAQNVFLQNKTIGNNHVQWDPNFTYKAWYKAQNKLTIGSLVTPKTDPGDYVIEATGNITVYAGQEINLKPGFHSQQGSEFHAYIEYDCYPVGGKSAQNTQNESKISKEVMFNENNVSQSVQKIENERIEISIYPNPSKAEVTVLFPVNLEGDFEIVNSIGALIQKNSVPSNYKSEVKLDTGIYFLHYQSNLGHKLIKQIIIL